jgi:ATP-dependent helicase HepA
MLNTATVATFDGEFDLLKQLIRAAVDNRAHLEAAIAGLYEKVYELVEQKFKVVIFCSEQHIADQVYLALHVPLNAVRHVVRTEDYEQSEEAPAWTTFGKTGGADVIVCDRRAEEGLNLQGGRKILVHFDLPLDPNRIEQRIGRLDRYGTGTTIRSIALISNDCKLHRAWYSLLSTGLDVFGRSISSLQYLVEEQLSDLRPRVLRQGVEGFSELTGELGGKSGLVARELKQIDEQDALDELAPQPQAALDALYEVDEDWRAIKSSTEEWVVHTLLFERQAVASGERSRVPDPPFRFRYRVPTGAGVSTLVPLSGFLDDFLGALDFEAPGGGSRAPLSFKHSFHRQTAISNGIRPLRYGTEFMEAMKSFCDTDDRGRSYAVWRHIRNAIPEGYDRLHFRFTFVIECDLDYAKEILREKGIGKYSNIALQRRADALFAPIMVDVWIDEDGDEPGTDLLALLNRPYKKGGMPGDYLDTNLRPDRLRYLTDSRPERFGNWPLRCQRLRDAALEVVRRKSFVVDGIREAVNRKSGSDEIRFAQLEARVQQLQGAAREVERDAMSLEKQLALAIEKGINNPRIGLDVAGMVYVTDKAFSMASIVEAA